MKKALLLLTIIVMFLSNFNFVEAIDKNLIFNSEHVKICNKTR